MCFCISLRQTHQSQYLHQFQNPVILSSSFIYLRPLGYFWSCFLTASPKLPCEQISQVSTFYLLVVEDNSLPLFATFFAVSAKIGRQTLFIPHVKYDRKPSQKWTVVENCSISTSHQYVLTPFGNGDLNVPKYFSGKGTP